MKICFPKYSFSAFRAKKLGRCPVWLIVVCFLTVICGSYVLKNYFDLWVIIGLGIGGILVSGRVSALLNMNKINRIGSAPVKKSVPQRTTGWDYRPKDVTRRGAPVDRGGAMSAEATGSNRSSPNGNDNVWLNFTNSKPPVEKATIKKATVGQSM